MTRIRGWKEALENLPSPTLLDEEQAGDRDQQAADEQRLGSVIPRGRGGGMQVENKRITGIQVNAVGYSAVGAHKIGRYLPEFFRFQMKAWT